MKEEANCNDNVCTRETLGEVGSRRIYLQLNLKFVTDVWRARTGRGRPSCIMMHLYNKRLGFSRASSNDQIWQLAFFSKLARVTLEQFSL